MNKALTALLVIITVFVTCGLASGQTDVNMLDEQLLINKNALLTGNDEQIRIQAAALMLESSNSSARSILLEVLTDVNNPNSQNAICKALVRVNADRQIEDKQSFIEPLLKYLALQKDSAVIKMAADSLLIFEYSTLEPALMATISDRSLPSQARQNAVYALRRQPDIRAIVTLINLLDDADPKVVETASQALDSLAIPAVKADQNTRRIIIEDLQRIGKEESLRYWQIRQSYEKQLNELKAQKQYWQDRCLTLLNDLYDHSTNDEIRKIELLSRSLTGNSAAEKLWALAKLKQWWVGTEPKSKVLAELGPLLIKIISDENLQVRLNTAELVGLMPELDSAMALLSQHNKENNIEAKIAQFIALGHACAYAFSPQSSIKLDSSIRTDALNLAVEYLKEAQPVRARKGVQVIRDLLANDGIAPSQVDFYLESLVSQYDRDNIDISLRSELLDVLASLCGNSAYRQKSIERFKPLFEKALKDENEFVREAAVNGIINSGKSEALRSLRTGFTNDTNANIRKKLIGLADEVGTAEDLEWLSARINDNSEGALAWKTMLKIFEVSDTTTLVVWYQRLKKNNLSSPRQIIFLEILERKALAANDSSALLDTWRQLAQLYTQAKQYSKATQTLASLLSRSNDPAEAEAVRAQLLFIYFESDQFAQAMNLLGQRLLESDIAVEEPLGKAVVDHINASENKDELVENLKKINIPQPGQRSQWLKLIESLDAKPVPQANTVESIPADPNQPLK